MKDTLVITASGAQVLPFIKMWGTLPVAILLTFFLTKLMHKHSQEKIFYIATSGFLAFFLFFVFVLYPFRDILEPHQTANYLAERLPRGLSGLINLYRHWVFSLFYIISELWTSIILSTLFWGVANEVTPIGQAKRFYGVFGIASNFAALTSGLAANGLALIARGSWDNMIYIFIMAVTFGGFLMMLIFRWHCKTILTKQAYPNLHSILKTSSKKKKPSLRESFKLLSKSKYLLHIAILVVSYNLVVNVMDVVWKDRLHHYCSTPQLLNHYMNNVTAIVGFLSLIITLFIPKILERFGWTKTALITPIAMGISGAGFFTFLFFGQSIGLAGTGLITPLAIAVFFGSMQHCLSKSMKYSVFDSTQNMAFIPLDHNTKYQGKAPIDLVGSRFGKSGGSLIYQGLLLFVGSISACLPFIAIIFAATTGFWLSATRNLGKMFNALVDQQAQEEESEAAADPAMQPS